MDKILHMRKRILILPWALSYTLTYGHAASVYCNHPLSLKLPAQRLEGRLSNEQSFTTSKQDSAPCVAAINGFERQVQGVPYIVLSIVVVLVRERGIATIIHHLVLLDSAKHDRTTLCLRTGVRNGGGFHE